MSNLRISVKESDHIIGDIETAKIVLVEYGDYQCPYCGIAFPLVNRFVKDNKGSVAFVFRNFPLRDAHRFAEISAKVAEASALQGKFWEMHDLIYNNQDKLSDEMLNECISTLHLDSKQAIRDINSSSVSEKIETDFEGGVRSGVNGTPSFFVNGTKWDTYDGTYESFEKLL